jgi:hypothetical protein
MHRDELVQEREPLGYRLLAEYFDAGRIASRAGKTGDQTELNRVLPNSKHDRDRSGRGL